MKKRRIVLSSHLVVAILVMGIGFAALADTLDVSGSAPFRPASVVATDVNAAIKFLDATPDEDYCVSADVDKNNDDKATGETARSSLTERPLITLRSQKPKQKCAAIAASETRTVCRLLKTNVYISPI